MLGSQSKQAFSHSKKEISRFKGHFVIWCWAMLMTATWSSWFRSKFSSNQMYFKL